MKSIIAILFFLVSFFLHGQAHGQEKIMERISPSLQRAMTQGDSSEFIEVVAVIDTTGGFNKMPGIVILAQYAPAGISLIKIKAQQLRQMIREGKIIYADLKRTPREELTTGSLHLGLNGLSLAHHRRPSTSGQSIRVSIKEQAFDTSDIDLHNRSFNSGVASGFQSSHASIMATILGGGGNTSPLAKGAAPGVLLTSSSFSSLLPDADSIYRKHMISVQNHSYGTGIENFYAPDANAYDHTVWNTPGLLHIFSSGNSGTQTSATGPYAGIAGYANITGSFKMSKNSLSVGATDSFNRIAPASSRGPAYDGRVKPELVAFGEEGSSGAAALVSGTAAILQDAYKQQYNRLPDASVLRAVLVNTADDREEAHVDYITGYGSLNASSALEAINKNLFTEGEVEENEVFQFPLVIPAQTASAKITLAWTDTAGPVNAARALVNDLDLVVRSVNTGTVWRPWVLNNKPHPDSLSLPAIRMRDSLNNQEQVTLENPDPGNYILEVSGTRVQTSNQSFALTWQLDTMNAFQFIYPTGSEKLAAGSRALIHWRTNISGSGDLEYSLNGSAWLLLASNLNLNKPYASWVLPDGFSKARLRFSIPSGNQLFYSDSFSIAPVLNMKVGFNCPDSFLLYWNSIQADAYRVYQLGLHYMEPLFLSADSFKVFAKAQHPSLHYSVAPVRWNVEGPRSFALKYTQQGVDCYFRNFLVQLSGRDGLLTTSLGSNFQLVKLDFEKYIGGSYQTINSQQAGSTFFSYTDTQLLQGINLYRVALHLQDGRVLYSAVERIYYPGIRPVLVFPNPARQNQPIRIITGEADRYRIEVIDARGSKVMDMVVNDVLKQIPPLFLPSGIYFIRVWEEGVKPFTQKLIVQ
jgi:hypothetical protein